jgi:hypothetical protein
MLLCNPVPYLLMPGVGPRIVPERTVRDHRQRPIPTRGHHKRPLHAHALLMDPAPSTPRILS